MGDDAPTVAQRITYFRERAGMTKAELAKALCVTPGAVTQWEDGSATPTVTNLTRIAEVCGVDMRRFYGAVARAAG